MTLEMTAHWTPTVRAYFGRVTKAHILAAVRDALGDEAAERLADKKKVEMAEAAEQLGRSRLASARAHRAPGMARPAGRNLRRRYRRARTLAGNPS